MSLLLLLLLFNNQILFLSAIPILSPKIIQIINRGTRCRPTEFEWIVIRGTTMNRQIEYNTNRLIDSFNTPIYYSTVNIIALLIIHITCRPTYGINRCVCFGCCPFLKSEWEMSGLWCLFVPFSFLNVGCRQDNKKSEYGTEKRYRTSSCMSVCRLCCF